MSPRQAPRLGVVDHGAGNLVSIGQALEAVGATVRAVLGPGDLAGLDGLIVPGVGAAGPAMARLHEQGLVEPIRAWTSADRPFLGICLGLQLLFDASEEDGATTLGIVRGTTRRLANAPTLPHIGWNDVTPRFAHPLFVGIAPGAPFYFVHSYAGSPDPSDPAAAGAILAETTHGAAFVSALARGNLLAVQFHPERSGDDGLRLLANFATLAVRTASAGA